MKPRIKPRVDADYYFYNHDGSLIQWKDLSLERKQNLTEAIVSTKLLYKYLIQEDVLSWDNFISMLINRVVYFLVLAKCEIEFSDQLNRVDNFKSLKRIEFPKNLISIDVPYLKYDIESEARNSFMPNLTRGERS